MTANNRIRSHLLRAYVQQKTNRVIKAPEVYTFQQWFNQQWLNFEDATSLPIIINNEQRRYIWQKVISASDLASALLQPGQLAQQADNALRYLEQWNIDPESLVDSSFTLPENTLHLLEWIPIFQKELDKVGLMTQEKAMIHLKNSYVSGQLFAQNELLLLGFDDIPPLQQDLLNAAFLCVETFSTPPTTTKSLARVALKNQETEIESAAIWAKNVLLKDSSASIGIIVPNLGQCRDQVERIFIRVFLPQFLSPQTHRSTLPFNFSAGTPLGATPIISIAHQLLALENKDWPLDEICSLLSSPFWRNDEDNIFIFWLIDSLKRLERLTISAAEIRYQTQKIISKLEESFPSQKKSAESFLKILNQSAAEIAYLKGFKTIGQWIDLINVYLSNLNWPGPRVLDSIEHQQVSHWHALLERLIDLSAVAGKVNFNTFCQELIKAANATPFQAQTPLSPIQILGALEGAALSFSHVWILGMHHRQWPGIASPNPFLPHDLQRNLGMPHASAERELVFAESLTKHYKSCAEYIYFSYPTTIEDQELHCSPLIEDIDKILISDILAGNENTCDLDNHLLTLLTNYQCDTLIDNQGPPVNSHTEIIKGGASILKEQSACAFNAFARFRLGARNPNKPSAGLSYIERGNILHEVLANIWKLLKNHASLCMIEDHKLAALITNELNPILNKVSAKRGLNNLPLYIDVERQRLEKIIFLWLQEEKRRPPFTVISIEEPIKVIYQGLELNLRLDRIDQLENGDLLLIDYKTGNPSKKDWSGSRPKDPQLPFYCLTTLPAPIAISFARVSIKAQTFIGMGGSLDQPLELEFIEDWEAQKTEWAEAIQGLAKDFMDGVATVDFRDEEAKRHSNDLTPLNRHLTEFDDTDE